MSKLDLSNTIRMCGGLPEEWQAAAGTGRGRSTACVSDFEKPRPKYSATALRPERANLDTYSEFMKPVMRSQRRGDGKRAKGGKACGEGECRGRHAHADRIKPPHSRKCRDHKTADDGDRASQIWEDSQQKRNCIGVDDHDIDEIDGREQDRFFEPSEKDEGHEHGQRKRRRRDRAPQHHDPERVEQD